MSLKEIRNFDYLILLCKNIKETRGRIIRKSVKRSARHATTSRRPRHLPAHAHTPTAGGSRKFNPGFK